ncbi:fimbrial protein [Yersinia frederiksenii]|uniref:Fimbrial protein n=2 Tax=Yersinia frederiksenii TaxID=29484 RepID=A0A380PTM6_YERFR|nr:hypothetical protein [Yersinia frederiksenii]ATM94521.1 hypothetical protein CRN75_03355 [Yersinia frederiksenii]EEQ16343.1 hypothetical protein yfred0001_34310 [Yersinia frederiksenii ATCC 33641]KGA48740.1 hypothetical protein DJ58_4155 [Yersinia frederiksenii ATCC 33641]MDN0120127.1 hypothetical protein [Yersinia frederiksenii]CFR07259.1 fimbrial protein [Yersinia frederiksenii]
MKKVVPIILLSLFSLFSSKTMALNCTGVGDVVIDSVVLDKMVYLSNSENGDVIWESDVFTRNITCTSSITEPVYIYAYPKMASETLPDNVEMGLFFDGHDLGTMDATGDVTSRRTNTGWTVNGGTPLVKNGVTFQTYLKKTGDINTAGVTNITLFQLDGEGGLNTMPTAKNYKFVISGWNNVGTLDCRENITGGSFSVTSETDQVVAGTASSQINHPTIAVTCTGDASSLSMTKSISGRLDLLGSGGSFSTNKEGLTLSMFYEGTELRPNDDIIVDIPVSSGSGSKVFSFDVKPALSVLQLNNPSWLFSDSDEAISATIPFSFTPTRVNLN